MADNKANIKRVLEKLSDRASELTGNKFEFEMEDMDEIIEFYSDEHFQYQDQGVSGTKKGVAGSKYGFKDKMPPPSSFSKYTNDKQAQFAIAKSIQQEGIEKKNYVSMVYRDRKFMDLVEEYYGYIIDNELNKLM